MKKNVILLCVLLVTLSGCMDERPLYETTPKEPLPTEQFIKKQLMNEGRVQTNITTLQDDYLAESLGLWMLYLIEKQDYEGFLIQFKELENRFLLKQKLVSWQITQNNRSNVSALIDDLRIVEALQKANELWGDKSFGKVAEKIEKAIIKYEMKDNLLVDFYDTTYKESANKITLSYIAVAQLDFNAAHQTIAILEQAPVTETGFFPFAYDVKKQTYEFTDEVNLIDQFYIGYHLAAAGLDVTTLLTYCNEALKQYGKLYGRVDAKSLRPTVSYESPAVYALGVLMALESGEKTLAKNLYEQMLLLRVQDATSDYDGGYIDSETLETHAFDNLLPLLAERRFLDAKVF